MRISVLLQLLAVTLLLPGSTADSASFPRPGAEAGERAVLLVPIVLDVAGAGGARYTTELTLVNRGRTLAGVEMTFTAATAFSGKGTGTVTTTLGPGRQRIVGDFLAFLRAEGLAIPAGEADQGGTLLVTFTGVLSADDVAVVARTTTPSGTGQAGLSYPAVRMDEVNGYHGVQTGTSWLYGLRENDADRTNVALVNASLSSAITLRVSVFNATGLGAFRGPDHTLDPGQWTQIDRILAGSSIKEGFARIDVISGTGPYYAYAVFNDNVTNDGSFVPLEADAVPPEPRLLPVLVETEFYRSELILVNAYTVPQTITLYYVESLSPHGGKGGSASVTLGPAQQRIIPDAIEFLRQEGVEIGPKGAAPYAGSLAVISWQGRNVSDGFAAARTLAASGQGGLYGVAYAAHGLSEGADEEGWVFGLQSNASARSNLAVACMGDRGGGLTVRFEVYDGDTGLLAEESGNIVLDPGAWIQINDVLRPSGTRNGYIRIRRTRGVDRFTAYGVVNDGETPTSGRTNDGSYISFRNR